jgi:GNAT superfamily N-acetyltransferase
MRATRTYLDMRAPTQLRAVPKPAGPIRLERLHECPPSFYRYLYHEVGRAWRWFDRAGWSDAQARQHLARPEITIWLLSYAGAPAGYFELQDHGGRAVEIVYFGLLPEFLGRRLGGWLLTAAVEAAWSLGAERVWLHTCTFDHPAALPNYLARGFEITRTEDYEPSLTTENCSKE